MAATPKPQVQRAPAHTATVEDILFTFKQSFGKHEWLKIPCPIFYGEKVFTQMTSVHPSKVSTSFQRPYIPDYPDEPKVFLSFKKIAHEDFLDKVVYKKDKIESNTILALTECIQTHKFVTILKLENCNLTSAQVELLSDLLKTNKSVRDLSVNGNPNNEQNYHVLLHDTKLLSLSLKFCGIDINGVKKISDELSSPLAHPLLHLNLASNMLMDEGMEYVAKVLRVNRVLISLNLADNKIRNKGCQRLMETLQKFSLTHDEIVVRRRIKFDLHKKNVLDYNIESGKSMTRKSSAKNLKKSLKEKSSLTSLERNKSSSFLCESSYHPFLHDSEEVESEIYCKGNEVLTNLNLSYNRIGKEGGQSIISMLDYQRNNYANDRGISRISVEGNHDVNVLGDIEELLAKKMSRCSSSRSRSRNSINKNL